MPLSLSSRLWSRQSRIPITLGIRTRPERIAGVFCSFNSHSRQLPRPNTNMDDYPAGDTIPDPSLLGFDSQHNELVEFLTNSREMRETARSSLKQAAYAAGGALVGGFLLGPVGGLVGGISGSLIGFFKSDNYDGAVMSICKLDEHQKKTLMTRVGRVLVAAGATAQQLNSQAAFRETLVTFASQPTIREEIWKACAQSMQA